MLTLGHACIVGGEHAARATTKSGGQEAFEDAIAPEEGERAVPEATVFSHFHEGVRENVWTLKRKQDLFPSPPCYALIQ